MKKILCLIGFVALAAGNAQAAVYVWNGSSDGSWNVDANWEGASGEAVNPVFDNTAVIQIAGTENLDQWIRSNRTVKSLEFTGSNTGATAIGLRANDETVARDLIFASDAGNSTLTVDAAASGNKLIGADLNGANTLGKIVLESDLDITHNGAGSLIFAKGIEGGSRNITLAGTGMTVFSGTNTYMGNTTVDGALTLSDDAQLAFIIGTNGVNNVLSGSGSVTLDGDFILDLTGAGRTLGDSWQLVDVASFDETFGTTFRLVSSAGAFAETNGVWSISVNSVDYAFAENTGLLTVVNVLPAAHWMSGEWGIGFRFRADDKSQIANWDVNTLVSQVKSIPGVRYVIFNLSDAAHGDAYIAPHSVLSVINPGSTPNNDRDLFMEMAQGFQTNGIKVIAYMATQGPAMLKHGAENAYDSVEVSPGVFTSQAMDNWSNYVESVYGNTTTDTYMQAYAEVIVDEYAQRYGTLIDGWWFDHAGLGNIPLLHDVVTAANPDTVIAFNTGEHVPLTNNSPDYEDFTAGHPTPVAQVPASDQANLPMLTSIEATPDGYFDDAGRKSLGHMYMPMQDQWNSGDIVWELDQAADWMERCMNAGGAWTWNVDVSDNLSMLRADTVMFMTNVIAQIAITNSVPVFTVDPIVKSDATAYVAYVGTINGSATDEDGDPLTYALVSAPTWLSVATNGMLSGTPTIINVGLNSFTVQVTDDNGGTNSATLEITVVSGVVPTDTVQFDNLRGLIGTMPQINGANITDPNVSITKATNGNDVVYSLSIINQDLDGGGTFTDSLSWDIRVKGFSGGSFVLNGNDSAVTLGSNVLVGTINNEFGVSGSDNRFVSPGESIQFSVENLVLTADAGYSAQFNGFSGLWGTSGSYIYGEGAGGLESQAITNNGALTFATNAVLVVSPTANSERIRDLDGSFTVSAALPAVTNASFTIIHDGGQDYPGMTYTRVITPVSYIIETTTNLTTSTWVPRNVGPTESDVTIIAGPVDNTDGTETLSFRVNQSTDSQPSMFLRVKSVE